MYIITKKLRALLQKNYMHYYVTGHIADFSLLIL